MVDIHRPQGPQMPPSRPAEMAAPRPRIEETPEFRDAVQAAVAKATTEILAKLHDAGAPASDANESFARTLAMEIARIADQGTDRKRLSPEEAIKREMAYERMINLVAKYRAEGPVPEYELVAATQLEEQVIPPTYTDRNHVQRKTQIAWPGLPNEAMKPTNESAQEIFTAYREYLGGAAPKVTHQAGKGGSLVVKHKGDAEPNIPPVGKPRGGDLQILGRHQAGEVIETRVLGTVAAPARQTG